MQVEEGGVAGGEVHVVEGTWDVVLVTAERDVRFGIVDLLARRALIAASKMSKQLCNFAFRLPRLNPLIK